MFCGQDLSAEPAVERQSGRSGWTKQRDRVSADGWSPRGCEIDSVFSDSPWMESSDGDDGHTKATGQSGGWKGTGRTPKGCEWRAESLAP